MNRIGHSRMDATLHDGPTGLPRRLLRHLIVSQGIGVGSRVLDAGCGSGELTGYLSLLGIDATGLDSSPAAIAAARRAVPNLDFHLTRSEQDVPPPDRPFDLVIVRELTLYRESLASREAFRTTARLLSGLRPGGTLSFLTQTGAAQQSSAHTTACYRRHLSGFPGAAACVLFRDGLLQQFSPEWLSRRRSPAGHLVITIQTPSPAVEQREWLRYAESAAATHRQPCCGRGHQTDAAIVRARAA